MAILVGKPAPSFCSKALVNGEVVKEFSLDDYLGEKYVVFFFYPKDFSPLCPSELLGFQDALAEFESRDTVVVGCSTDTEYSHRAWHRLPREQGGIAGVTYPIVADTNKTIASAFDVLAGDYDLDDDGDLIVSGELVAYRGLFLIDKEGIVQHQLVNNMPIGRSASETLRMLDAVRNVQENGEICPFNWEKS